jgi:DNA-binding NtrC family response regulator
MKTAAHRVLIVDPDPIFADKATALLLSQGYEVEVAEGVRQAVEKMNDIGFSCMIVDEDLTEMKGYDAVPIFQAISPKIPIIITAAQNTPQQEDRIRQQDVFYYYVKGFDMDELQMAVDDALIVNINRKQKGIHERR